MILPVTGGGRLPRFLLDTGARNRFITGQAPKLAA